MTSSRQFIIMEMYSYILYFSFLSLYSYITEGARILGIFPLPAKSYFTYNHAILKSLVEAGHDVTVITSFPEQAAEANYTSIIDLSEGETILVNQSSHTQFAKNTIIEFFDLVVNSIEIPLCYKVTNHPEIQKILKSDEKLYDVVFVGFFSLYDCFLPVAEKMGVPAIGTITYRSWLLTDRYISNPNYPAYIPVELSKDMEWDARNFLCRLRNVWDFIIVKWYRNFHLIPLLRKFHQKHIDLFGQDGKFIDMQLALVFYNNHPTFFPRPMNPNAIEVGGIHVRKAKPLPQNIRKFIDEAEHGVIFLSFGSVTKFSLFPIKTQNVFKEALSEIPQRVIWKYEDEMENISSNVMIAEWLPQRDILEHRNVKAFITHCGQGGTYEAVYTATPMIGIPLFADQHSVAAVLKNLHVAVLLEMDNISKEKLLAALSTIINDTSYSKNMKRLSTAFKDRPMTPQQSVVYWTEYVIKHNGAPHLKTAAALLNWFQYLLLDVLCFVVLSFAFISYLIYCVIKVIVRSRPWGLMIKIKSD